jgi:hypothetical protein
MLLLMCQYLQSTQNPNDCWVVLGNAIRGAQSIGLHITPKNGTPLEQELKKRVWYGCVYLDRLARPISLANRQCPGGDMWTAARDLIGLV